MIQRSVSTTSTECENILEKAGEINSQLSYKDALTQTEPILGFWGSGVIVPASLAFNDFFGLNK